MPKRSDTYPTVPAELKALHQWVLLKEELRDGKPTKIPYQVDGDRANANDPNTWTDYQTICNHRDRFSDIGFVFSKDDPYCGIYIHDAINVSGWHGDISRWAVPLILGERGLSSVAYQEYSSSRNAIKFWTRAKLPDWMNRGKSLSALDGRHLWVGPAEIEVYHYGRYFTVTGKGMGEIKDAQAIINSIVCLIEQRARKDMEEESDEVCDKCNSKMVIKWGRRSKFLACTGYPKCKNAKPINIGVDCPEANCGGYIGERRSKRGKVFYGCSNYPKCDFVAWDKPVNKECPACGALFLIEKSTKTKGRYLACNDKTCGYAESSGD